MENRRATVVIPECALVCSTLDCSPFYANIPRVSCIHSEIALQTSGHDICATMHMHARCKVICSVWYLSIRPSAVNDDGLYCQFDMAAPTSTQYRPWQLTRSRKVSIIGQYMTVSAYYTTNRSDAITCVFPHDDYGVSPCLGLIGVFYRIGRANHWVISARITAHKLQFSRKKHWTDIFWGFLSGGVKCASLCTEKWRLRSMRLYRTNRIQNRHKATIDQWCDN